MLYATDARRKATISTQCWSKNVDESGLETAAATTTEGETAWFAEILVGKGNKKKVTFKLDTGAEVTAVSQETYQMLPDAPPLSTPQRTLCGPSRKPVPGGPHTWREVQAPSSCLWWKG
jgi:hypothetical protein